MSLRVLMIGWEYPPKNSGGLGVACQGIVEHLVEAGQDLLLVLPSEVVAEEKRYLTTKSGKKYPVFLIPSRLKPYVSSHPGKYAGNLKEDVFLFARDAVKMLAGETFDLIHVHDWLTVPAGRALQKQSGKPLIMHVHSTEYDRTAGGEPNPEVAEIEQAGLREANCLIAVSYYTKKILTEKYGVPAKKIRVIHNGVDPPPETEVFREDFLGTAPIVLFVGRLTIQKGPEYFIRLAKKVLRSKPETIFVIAGDGEMYQCLVENSALAELTGSILFAGFLRGMTMEKLYRRAEVLVMPSVSEPFGLVALEAAIRSVPVIVSKTAGVAEVLPSAIKIDFWDCDLMAEEILNLIMIGRQRELLGKKLKEEAQILNWQRAVSLLQKNYRELFQV